MINSIPPSILLSYLRSLILASAAAMLFIAKIPTSLYEIGLSEVAKRPAITFPDLDRETENLTCSLFLKRTISN